MNVTSMRPIAAARAIRRVFADPDATEHVFEVIDALQGPNLKRMRARLLRSNNGRRLLATKPNLLPLLNDREALRALPDGSLGRAYLAFVESEGIGADGLVAASEGARKSGTDEEFLWIKDWLRDTHDLWHTVLGYKGDLVGEAALLAFSHYETGNLGVGAIAALAWLKLGRVTDPRLGARATVRDGRRLAKKAAWFLEVPWHEWLGRPLEEVRHDLRVAGPVQYRPVRSSEVDVSLLRA
jgi:ubiquinone biosynthesis protein COQ4